jgi:ubiquitin carboxyl-terminal hydrolase 1
MNNQYGLVDVSLPGINFIKANCPTTPGAIIFYVFIALLGIYTCLHQSERYALLSPLELLWNCLVYATPPSLVLALDKSHNQSPTSDDNGKTTYAASRTFAAKSTAMRQMLGLDGTGVLTKVQRTRSLSGFGSIFKSPSSKALPGLGNWDNSCYQNSILQGLSSLPSLHTFLMEARRDREEKESWATNEALLSLIEALNSTKNIGQRIWTPPALKNMSSWQQQDAQEYYSKVVDEMEKEAAKSVGFSPARLSLGARKVGLEALYEDTAHPGAHDPDDNVRREKDESFTEMPGMEANTDVLSRNPLEGLLAQRVGCLQCGYVEGLSMIPFNCLTVPLGRQYAYDLRDCLDDYTTLEPISGVECAKCTLLRTKQQLERLLSARQNPTGDHGEAQYTISGTARNTAVERLKAVNEALSTEDFSEPTISKKCMITNKNRVTSTKSRQAVIARAPRSLVIHVNRSMFDEYSGMLSKNYADVRFPRTLDLSTWCLGTSSMDNKPEVWNTNPSESMLADHSDVPEVVEDTKPSKELYRLRAIVTHYGRHENGHYIAYRQTPARATSEGKGEDEEQWWRLSDEDVSTVSEENVLDQGGVFMMFYERLPDSESLRGSSHTHADSAMSSFTECVSIGEAMKKAEDAHGETAEWEGRFSKVQTGSRANVVAAPRAGQDISFVSRPLDIEETTLSDNTTQSKSVMGRAAIEKESEDSTLQPLAHADMGSRSQIPRMRTSSVVTTSQDFDPVGQGSSLVQAV